MQIALKLTETELEATLAELYYLQEAAEEDDDETSEEEIAVVTSVIRQLEKVETDGLLVLGTAQFSKIKQLLTYVASCCEQESHFAGFEQEKTTSLAALNKVLGQLALAK